MSTLDYEKMEEAITRRGKSVILPGGAHVATVDQLPSKAKLAKGDPAAEARVKAELRAQIQKNITDLAELGEPYEPVNEIVHPSELPEDDPRRFASTVPKDGAGQPQTPKQEQEALKRETIEAEGGTSKGATAPVDEKGDKAKGLKQGQPVAPSTGPQGAGKDAK